MKRPGPNTGNLVGQLSTGNGAISVAAAAVTVSTAVLGASKTGGAHLTPPGGGCRDSLKHQVRSLGPARMHRTGL